MQQVESPATVKPARATLLAPLAPAAALLALLCIPQLRGNVHVLFTLVAAAAILCTWDVLLVLSHRSLVIEWAPKKQHYIQACAQASVFLYWGWYWRPVYEFAPFIVAQLVFAYGFDILLCWSRRERCILGFAPFPVIFSINLFLWFKPDWFYLQFLMVATGLTAKEFIRWNREGKRVHIFNPSSFPLAVFSLVLLATGSSGITWGQEIATTQFYPPQMYLYLFLAGLPGQFFFGVTSMTMSAVAATWLFGRLYFAATGIYFFYDSYIPIAVFLGMHLLFNDPATSPRTSTGRILYGALYGLSTAGLYELLGRAGLPAFYDKLLPVPLLNLLVPALDWLARSRPLVPSYRRNLAYMAAWALFFAGLSLAQDLSDWHPGQFLPFWTQACEQGRPYACPYLADLETGYCDRGSGWACNEAGLMDIALSRSGEDLRRTQAGQAAEPWMRGCELRFEAACRNLNALHKGGALTKQSPKLTDYPVILRGSKGEISDTSPAALDARGCREGWRELCMPQ